LPFDLPLDKPTVAAVSAGEEEHILVVDDEPQVGRALTLALRDAGFQVTTADGAEQALDLLDRHRIDLVLSDLSMPGLDGIAFWRAISRCHPHLAERVIFASGDTRSKQTLHFLQSHDCAYLEKPFGPDELLRMVRQVLYK
jgi:two-component system NtrC family sensor kinase